MQIIIITTSLSDSIFVLSERFLCKFIYLFFARILLSKEQQMEQEPGDYTDSVTCSDYLVEDLAIKTVDQLNTLDTACEDQEVMNLHELHAAGWPITDQDLFYYYLMVIADKQICFCDK